VTYRIRYSQTARSDLLTIDAYLCATSSPDAADRFIRRVIAKVETLRVMPARYRIRNELQPGLRAALVDKYLLFYQVSDDTVSIVRVLHGARDITAELFSS
jgi:toxin ParE1/3/4